MKNKHTGQPENKQQGKVLACHCKCQLSIAPACSPGALGPTGAVLNQGLGGPDLPTYWASDAWACALSHMDYLQAQGL